jgi:hypothetical protein
MLLPAGPAIHVPEWRHYPHHAPPGKPGRLESGKTIFDEVGLG